MTYTTTLEIVQKTGIGVQVMNENVGTGDSTEKDYDLNNGNVIASSYTLKYAASGSNDFTELTETTHYTLDKDGGSILLTTAGATELSTNVLYADYTHSPKISDTILNSFLEQIDDEIDKLTGNYWGSVTNNTEWFDGRRSFTYPTTDEPYTTDWDEPDFVELKYKSIQSLTGVYFLNNNMIIGSGQTYDSVAATYTDNTTDINSGETAFQPFATTTAANDYLYIGCNNQFHSLNTVLFVQGVTSGTNTIEYYNGSGWTAITTTESTTGILNFSASGSVSWNRLGSWTKTSVNSSEDLYFVRVKANNTYSTEAQILNLYVGQDFIINENIPLSSLTLSENGKLTFINKRFPNGTRNIRVDYTHGYTTTPPLISELAAILGGIMSYANITGGSYDDATSYSIDGRTVSIGEVYVNVREVVRQFEVRKDTILNSIGKKNDLFVI